MDIMALLERLEETVSQATRVPLTGKILVDPEHMFNLLDAMREALPQEIRDANRVARDRDAILAEAREAADGMIREAQATGARLTSESTITRDAQAQADELIDQAKRVAREIRQNALEWADDLFAKVQPDLERVAVDSQKAALAVRKAREELRTQL